MTTKIRSTTRTIRIPLSVDEEVVQFGQEMSIDSINEAYGDLINAALKAFNYSKEIKENPEGKAKISKDFERFLEEAKKERIAEESLANLGKEELEIIMMHCHIELRNRQKKTVVGEAHIDARRALNRVEARNFRDFKEL